MPHVVHTHSDDDDDDDDDNNNNKAHMYSGIEESFDIQHKNEKEKLKKKYPRRQTIFWYRIKCKE